MKRRSMTVRTRSWNVAASAVLFAASAISFLPDFPWRCGGAVSAVLLVSSYLLVLAHAAFGSFAVASSEKRLLVFPAKVLGIAAGVDAVAFGDVATATVTASPSVVVRDSMGRTSSIDVVDLSDAEELGRFLAGEGVMVSREFTSIPGR